jgi:hypothetical protein
MNHEQLGLEFHAALPATRREESLMHRKEAENAERNSVSVDDLRWFEEGQRLTAKDLNDLLQMYVDLAKRVALLEEQLQRARRPKPKRALPSGELSENGEWHLWE